MKRDNILLIVQNNSFPLDSRVRKEAFSLKNFGFNVFVISPKSKVNPLTKEIVEGVTVYRYKNYDASGNFWGFILEYFNSMIRIYILTFYLLFNKKIKVVHCANPPDFFWPLALIAKLFKVKFIYDQHDWAPAMFNSKYKNSLLYNFLRLSERLSIKFADAIIVVNESFKKKIVKQNPDYKNKIAVIYNSPNDNFMPMPNRMLIEKYKNKKVILFVGFMSINDNIEIIVEAARRIIKEKGRSDVHFVLLGDGDVRRNIEEEVNRLDMSDYISFPGMVSHNVVQEYLFVADVCLAPDLPNGLNEYLTLVKIPEYMISKKPFVTFKLHETMRMAENAGIYVDTTDEYADAILYLLNHPEKSKELGELGHNIITKNYLWNISEKELLKTYSHLLNGLTAET